MRHVMVINSSASEVSKLKEDRERGNGVITYGSVIKLMHERTKFRLHSHDVPYGSGSGQQSVTGFPNVDDSNSYWIVRPVSDTNAQQGDTIKGGTIIRLQHMRTRKWLHSHLLNVSLTMMRIAVMPYAINLLISK
nr:stromal cell-derived factor 2-like protein [Coffea arabica]